MCDNPNALNTALSVPVYSPNPLSITPLLKSIVSLVSSCILTAFIYTLTCALILATGVYNKETVPAEDTFDPNVPSPVGATPEATLPQSTSNVSVVEPST